VSLRILANENVPGETVEAMRREGYDVTWVRTDAPGSSDEDILAQAQTEGRVLMTFDKDFGELAFRKGLPASSGVILVRAGTSGSAQATALVLAALRTRSDWEGHFSVVEADRIRMTALPAVRRES
jgi:predicted nuclease of predicted toxin-antitoxin system